MTSLSIDNVFSFGCSLAWGSELADRNKRYAKLIANNYNAKLFDYSIPGNSNENISQTAINKLLATKQEMIPSRTLVHIGWTYSTRLNYCGKDNRYYVIAEYNLQPARRKQKLLQKHYHIYFNDDFDDPMDLKIYHDNHTNLPYLIYNLTRHIHHAQLFLKSNGYNYIFSFASDIEKHLVMTPDDTYNALGIVEPYTNYTYPNFSHLMNDIDTSYICDVPFTSYVGSLNLKIGPDHHPLEEGHAAYAKVLIDFIEKKYGQQSLPGIESRVS